MYSLNDFSRGDRVELHPATDIWMSGARFGTISGVGRCYLTVRLDMGALVRFRPEDICNILAVSRRREVEWFDGDTT